MVGEGRTPRRASSLPSRGDEIGRYVVLEQLGRGGMGVVYSAFDPKLDRKVALKLLLHGAAPNTQASEGPPRLLREAQALAKLSHPNVITVHDVGTIDDAVFIAMEFIDGQTLSDWCETPRSWRELVRVLIAAGRGIAAAHRVGIVHRDFKPDNVMIGRDGRPRVLDFGLARTAAERSGTVALPERVLEPGASTSTLDVKLTETGAVMGTPAYMAPEQHTGERVDERTDQFAFCVTAYEALYGERPFAGESLAALAFQVHQGRIREPPKGSQVPSWLRKVIVRGLAVDPRERWPNMDELLRALARDPVRQRRRVALGLAVVATVAGLGALVQRSLGREQALCSGAAEHLTGVWDDDARAAVRDAFAGTGLDYADDAARAVEAALNQHADAWTRMHTEACEATRVRGEQSDEILTLRMTCLDRQLAQLAALVEVYREADADIVERALEASAALPPLSLCADIETLTSGVRPPTTAEARERVATLRTHIDAATSLELAGKRLDAREQLASIADDVLALDYRPLIAELELAYGPLLDNPTEQIERLERAVWMAEASRHDRVAARAWLALALAYNLGINDFARTDAALVRADAAITRIGGDDELHIRLLMARGQRLATSGDDKAALEPLRLAHAERERLGHAGSPQALAELVLLTNVLMNLDRADEAGPLLRAALPTAEASLGRVHPWVARLRATLGRVHYEAGELDQAEAALMSALPVFEHAYGDSHELAGVLNGLALVRQRAGRLEHALATYVRALEITLSISGRRNLHTTKIITNMAGLEAKLGRHDDARAHFEEALELELELLGEQHENIAWLRARLAELPPLVLETGSAED